MEEDIDPSRFKNLSDFLKKKNMYHYIILFLLHSSIVLSGYHILTFSFQKRRPEALCIRKNSTSAATLCTDQQFCNTRRYNRVILTETSLNNWALQFDLFCENEIYLSLLNSLMFLSQYVSGNIFNMMANAYGRKISVCIQITLLVVGNLMMYLSTNLSFLAIGISVCFMGSYVSSVSTIYFHENLFKGDTEDNYVIMNILYSLVGFFVSICILFTNDIREIFRVVIFVLFVDLYLAVKVLKESPTWLEKRINMKNVVEVIMDKKIEQELVDYILSLEEPPKDYQSNKKTDNKEEKTYCTAIKMLKETIDKDDKQTTWELARKKLDDDVYFKQLLANNKLMEELSGSINEKLIIYCAIRNCHDEISGMDIKNLMESIEENKKLAQNQNNSYSPPKQDHTIEMDKNEGNNKNETKATAAQSSINPKKAVSQKKDQDEKLIYTLSQSWRNLKNAVIQKEEEEKKKKNNDPSSTTLENLVGDWKTKIIDEIKGEWEKRKFSAIRIQKESRKKQSKDYALNQWISVYLWIFNQAPYYTILLNLDKLERKIPYCFEIFFTCNIISNYTMSYFHKKYGGKSTIQYSACVSALFSFLLFKYYDSELGLFRSVPFFIFTLTIMLSGSSVYLYTDHLFPKEKRFKLLAKTKLPSKLLLLFIPIFVSTNKYLFLFLVFLILFVPILMIFGKEIKIKEKY